MAFFWSKNYNKKLAYWYIYVAYMHQLISFKYKKLLSTTKYEQKINIFDKSAIKYLYFGFVKQISSTEQKCQSKTNKNIYLNYALRRLSRPRKSFSASPGPARSCLHRRFSMKNSPACWRWMFYFQQLNVKHCLFIFIRFCFN